MSFLTVLTDIALCNRALALLPAPPITAFDSSSTEAVVSAQWYKATVAQLLERHHWNLAVVRSPLTAATNDRPNRWRYAYARPAACAHLISLDQTSVAFNFRPSMRNGTQGADFEVIGQTIYTNIPATAAEYTSYDVTEASFDEEFAGVIAITLAARIVMPITKDRELAEKYQAQAADTLNRVIARDEVENWPSYGGQVSEVMAVLCNRALSLLPQDAIGSVDYPKRAARLARQWFAPTVGWLLEKSAWNLQTVRSPLVATTNGRASEWGYAYARPDDCAFLARVTDEVTRSAWGSSLRGTRTFVASGAVIYANLPVAYAEYTSYDTDPAAFDEQFCDVIVAMLAARFAGALTKNVRVAEQFKADAQAALIGVMARDMNMNPQTYGNTPTESEWVRQVGIDLSGGLYPADPTVPGTIFDPGTDPIGAAIIPDDAPPGDFYYEG